MKNRRRRVSPNSNLKNFDPSILTEGSKFIVKYEDGRVFKGIFEGTEETDDIKRIKLKLNSIATVSIEMDSIIEAKLDGTSSKMPSSISVRR